MSSIQVADQTFIAAAPAIVGAAVSNPGQWRGWWPDLRLELREARGDHGVRWSVAGPVTGTMEIWLEPALDGVILHYFLHAEPRAALPPAKLAATCRAYRVAGTRMSFTVKTAAEAGRAAGAPATTPREPDAARTGQGGASG